MSANAGNAKEAPLVSVIMNCYNSEQYLREAIDSVYAQTYQNWEIIFWDNASTDSSAAIAKSYDSRLKYHSGTETVPLGAARNRAIEKASGELIAFLDCDDLWYPEKLEKQVPLFKDTEVSLVYCDTLFFNSNGYRKRLYSGTKAYTGYCFSRLLSHYFLSMETIILRKESLKNLDYWFDERFNMIEEADLFRRVAMTGKLAMVDEVLSMWRMHSNSWTWKKTELVWIETRMMLETYGKKYEDFFKRYAKEVGILTEGIVREEAVFLIKNGDIEQARQKLKANHSSVKNMLLYLLLLLPDSWSIFFLRLKGKIL